MSYHIGKKIAIDNFVKTFDHRGPVSKNYPIYIQSLVIDHWFEPSQTTQSGKEFVRVEDGRVFWRYDCYASFSPYGWKLCESIENVDKCVEA